MSGGFNGFIETLRQLVLRLKLTGQEVGRESDNGARLAGDMHQQVTRQNRELESVVTAMNEMSVASAEVARFSEQAAIEAGQANQALQGTQGDWPALWMTSASWPSRCWLRPKR
ncbi:methyl-accepting chemotaxis protein [Oceanimonas sp. NS1]|nr:methyl-accepting chemotaxis protein [Oceanimonas sp. NS1]